MLGLSLFFIGAVLIVNGIGLTGRIDPKSSAILNLLVGFLALFINLLALVQASEPSHYQGVAAGLLFAFTYLYLAAVQWYALQPTGLGWYCLFVAISTVPFALLALQEAQIRMTLMWLAWGSLWLFFYLALVQHRNLGVFLAGYTILIGIVTCWVPGLLMLSGQW